MFSDSELLSYQTNLRRFARSLLRHRDYLMLDADDLVQITLTRALAKRDLFTPGNLKVWLFTIMHNEYQNLIRKANRNKECNLPANDYEISQVIDSRQQSDINLLVHDVEQALNSLPKLHSDVLKYMILKHTSYDACAKEFNIPTGTVRSRLSRARIKVKQHIS